MSTKCQYVRDSWSTCSSNVLSDLSAFRKEIPSHVSGLSLSSRRHDQTMSVRMKYAQQPLEKACQLMLIVQGPHFPGQLLERWLQVMPSSWTLKIKSDSKAMPSDLSAFQERCHQKFQLSFSHHRHSSSTTRIPVEQTIARCLQKWHSNCNGITETSQTGTWGSHKRWEGVGHQIASYVNANKDVTSEHEPANIYILHKVLSDLSAFREEIPSDVSDLHLSSTRHNGSQHAAGSRQKITSLEIRKNSKLRSYEQKQHLPHAFKQTGLLISFMFAILCKDPDVWYPENQLMLTSPLQCSQTYQLSKRCINCLQFSFTHQRHTVGLGAQQIAARQESVVWTQGLCH